MFKNKLFLNGLGIGLIMGAILLQIMIYADKPLQEQVSDNTIDETELIEAAGKLGYAVIKKEVFSTPSALEKLDKATAAPIIAPSPASEITLTPSSSPSPSPSPPPTASTTVKPTPATTVSPKGITVIIPRGSGSGAVGKLLVNSKVISDANEFENVVEDRRLTNKIQPGTFSFTGTETLDKVIHIITTVQ